MARTWYVVIALVGVALGGFVAVASTPVDTHTAGVWPVGIATGALILTTRRRRPVVMVIVLVLGIATLWLGGRSPGVAIGGGLACAVAAVVATQLLDRPRAPRVSLRSDADLRIYLLSCFASASCSAAVAAGTAELSGFGRPLDVGIGWGLTALGSQLVLLPIFLVLSRHVAVAGGVERTVERLLLVVAAPVVLLGAERPSVVFVMIPLIAWGAVRMSPREAMGQMIGLMGLAVALTAFDLGPFAGTSSQFNFLIDREGILLGLFTVTMALVTVPLILRVGEYVGLAAEASGERDLLRSIVDSATGVAIIGTDQHGLVTLFNPGAERLLGYRSEEVLGRPATMLHTRQAITDKAADLGVSDDYEVVAGELVTGQHDHSHMRFLLRDGTERTHAMTLTQLIEIGGCGSGRLSTSEDVTRGVEAQVATMVALRAERAAVVRLRDLDASKASFVSNVSHELRTPITSILGYLEMLVDGTYGDLADVQMDVALRISSNSNRLLSLIDDLLTLSRVEEGGIDMVHAEFDLLGAVEQVCSDMAASWAPPRHLTVDLLLPSRPLTVSGDRQTIERVVLNLLGNAVKFTPDGGSVRVSLTADGHHARLEVSDTGIGIPKDEQHLVFTRFFRSSLAQDREIPGSGLGLSISKSIVEQHGGSMTMTSAVDAGTTFCVILPRVGAASAVA